MPVGEHEAFGRPHDDAQALQSPEQARKDHQASNNHIDYAQDVADGFHDSLPIFRGQCIAGQSALVDGTSRDRRVEHDRTSIRRTRPVASALVERNVVALDRAGVELARAADLLAGIADHLVPLRDPADRAGQREQRGEHGGREADRREDHARVEIDVGEQLLLDEIGIVERHFLELQRHFEHRIVDLERGEHLAHGLLHHRRARIVVLVDAVAKAHQAERIVLVLGALDIVRESGRACRSRAAC